MLLDTTHIEDKDSLLNIYFIESATKPTMIKIGKAKDPESRLRALQTGSSARLRLIGSVAMKSDKQAFEVERHFHEVFADIRLNGEWFKKTGTLSAFIKDCIHRENTPKSIAARHLKKQQAYVENGHHNVVKHQRREKVKNLDLGKIPNRLNCDILKQFTQLLYTHHKIELEPHAGKKVLAAAARSCTDLRGDDAEVIIKFCLLHEPVV